MKYNDNGEVKEIKIKVADTLPIGTVVDYDGETVPSGYEEYGSDDYSTEETFTGKYYNSKKVYKKMFIGDIPSGTRLFNISYIDDIFDMKGTLLTDTYTHQIGAYYNSSYYSGMQFSNNYIEVFKPSSYYNDSAKYRIILEYTKTTD